MTKTRKCDMTAIANSFSHSMWTYGTFGSSLLAACSSSPEIFAHLSCLKPAFWGFALGLYIFFFAEERSYTRISRLVMMIYLIYMPDLCSIYKKGINVFFFLEAPLNTGESFAIFKVQAHLCWVAVPWKLRSSGPGYLTGPYCSRNFLLVLERGVCFSDMKGWFVLCSGCGCEGCACSGCSDWNAMEEICQLLPARAGGAQHPDHIHLTGCGWAQG